MTAPAQERPRCYCNAPMSSLPGGVWHCKNCDSIQATELIGQPRVRNMQDVRFDLKWMSEMRKQYGDLPPEVNTNDLYHGGRS